MVVRSAPADEINPVVEEALHEIGVPLTNAYPKPLTDEVVQASDVVITMGCGDACPIYPGKRYLDWELDDPAGQGLDAVRPIRDDIDRRVRELLAELVPAHGGISDTVNAALAVAVRQAKLAAFDVHRFEITDWPGRALDPAPRVTAMTRRRVA